MDRRARQRALRGMAGSRRCRPGPTLACSDEPAGDRGGAAGARRLAGRTGRSPPAPPAAGRRRVPCRARCRRHCGGQGAAGVPRGQGAAGPLAGRALPGPCRARLGAAPAVKALPAPPAGRALPPGPMSPAAPRAAPDSSGAGLSREAAAVAAIAAANSPADLAGPVLDELGNGWDRRGRTDQKPPEGDWRTWVLMGGRGAGKTRAGAEWIHRIACQAGTANVTLRVALVAETLGDAREIMIDGPSGIRRIARLLRPTFEASRRRLVWPNGAVAHVFSSEDPESLRGPQFDLAWCDELAKWTYAQETWDMLQFGLRLGDRPRQLVTTTPRPAAAAEGDPRRVRHRDDARPHRRQRRQPGAGLPRRHRGALWRQPPRPPGARRRADRGPRGRALAPRRRRAPAGAPAGARRPHRRRRRSAGGGFRQELLLRHRRRRPGRRRARRGAGGRLDGGREPRRLGPRRGRSSTGASTPTASSPRSTRAATWSPPSCAPSTRRCR